MTDADRMERLRRNTAKWRLLPTVGLALRNLRTAAGKRAATVCDPSRGAAVLASAGPSLDHAIEPLKRVRSTVTLFAVNTAVGALLKNGIVPDVIVSTEHVDIAKHADVGVAKHLVTVLGAAESVWARATHWVADPHPWTSWLMLAMGPRPLPHAGNVAPTAASLALEWGADPLILVGQDLGYSRDGQCYATGASWDKTRVEFNGDSMRFTHMPERQDAHRDAGVPGIPDVHETQEATAWGGLGTRLTAIEWVMQRDQLTAIAAGYAGRRLINATGGGIHIPGWTDQTLFDLRLALEPLAVPECAVTTQAQVDAGLRVILEEAECADRIARDELDNEGRGGAWLDVARGMPITTALCTPDWLSLQELKGMDPRAAIAARYSVVEAAPKWARYHLGLSSPPTDVAPLNIEPDSSPPLDDEIGGSAVAEPSPAAEAGVGEALALDEPSTGAADRTDNALGVDA